jgi:hypothetical protein
MSVAGSIPSPQPSHPSLPSSGAPSRYSNPVQTQRSAASSCEESPPWGAWLYERANPASATHRHGSRASDRLASECGQYFAPGGRGWPLATSPTYQRQTCQPYREFPAQIMRGQKCPALSECSFLGGGKGPRLRRKGSVPQPTQPERPLGHQEGFRSSQWPPPT